MSTLLLEQPQAEAPLQEDDSELKYYDTRDLVLMLHVGRREDRRRMEQIETTLAEMKSAASVTSAAIDLRLRTLERKNDQQTGMLQLGKTVLALGGAIIGAVVTWFVKERGGP